MSAFGEPAYYLRISGKVLGPFSLAKLQSLRDRGRLQPSHEVSTDRAGWVPASTVPGLFPDAGAADFMTAFADDDPEISGTAKGELWFYENDGQQAGPVGADRLRSLISSGRIQEGDQVWKSGLADWQPVEAVFDLPEAKSGSPGVAATSRAARSKRTKVSLQERGFWNTIIESVRRNNTSDTLEQFCSWVLVIGGVAMTLAAAALAAFFGVEAVREQSLTLAGLAGAAGLGFAVLQYVGRRMSIASHQLVSASRHRLSSTALPYSVAIVVLVAGLLMAAVALLSAANARTNTELSIGIAYAIQLAAVSVYAACTALHPQWMNIDCTGSVSAGEEGIGVLAFFLKITLRICPVIYGVCALGGMIGAFTALAISVADKGFAVQSMALAVVSMWSLVVATMLPLGLYLNASLVSIALDLGQAVLSIPNRLSASDDFLK